MDSSLLPDLDTFSASHRLGYLTVALQEGLHSTADDPCFLDAIFAVSSLRSFSVRGVSIRASQSFFMFSAFTSIFSLVAVDTMKYGTFLTAVLFVCSVLASNVLELTPDDFDSITGLLWSSCEYRCHMYHA